MILNCQGISLVIEKLSINCIEYKELEERMREGGVRRRKVWKVRESSRIVEEKFLESVFTDINRLGQRGQFKN
jgi:hypothetical protein